ncbi:Ribbon-helix-helix protein, copG family [Fulvimarina manganoxydans]|uniref:Ribbon-helix-helix protein, copG family n=1 Tax=Fulvimarina manganoxydans TaxID=937218 RepID=A0A1W2EY03_9HYPH|nr:ribbon-helix-helix protein, CopG family [Fulvimarina manganoxydans]MEE2950939.1 ribbon-helix-helix protein, CopG family [Pseudomonadota bacterium]SMD14579.1 Ribbon-helix-helix protein, copG family [Fulvimarina manganoxydans]
MKKLRVELLGNHKTQNASGEDTSTGKSPGATTIRVSQKILGKVDEEAGVEGLSRNELIVLLLDEFLRSRTGEGIEEIDPDFATFLKAKRRHR